jgi:hypothetical protein
VASPSRRPTFLEEYEMGRINDLFYKSYGRILQKNSNLVFRAILETPPIETDPESDTLLFTILDRCNYRAYLLAAKSLLQYCPPIRVVVQSDGSLDAACLRDLDRHLPGIQVLDPEESKAGVRAKADLELLRMLDYDGNCDFFVRLRFMNVVGRYPGKKIIIMDSDIVFLRNPEYVVRWIQEPDDHSAFHSDGGSFQTADFHALGLDFSKVDIGRFNAGFTGFYNTLTYPYIKEIVSVIYRRNPKLLREYEIEQSLWSVVFNSFDPVVCLDDVIKGYVASGYWSYERIKESVLVHFIGSVRFKNLRYLRVARDVIRKLKADRPIPAAVD